jgi:hypothetical protein
MAKRLLLLFFFLLAVGQIQAQDADKLSDYTIVKDFTSEWLVYDSDLESYVPYVLNTPFDYQSASFYLNSREFSGGKLICALQAGSALLVDQKVVAVFPQEKVALYDVDSLAEAFGQGRLFVTIYHPEFNLEENQVGITANTFTISAEKTGYGAILKILPREYGFQGDFIVTVLLFLAACVAAMRYRYPKFSRDFMNIPKAYALNVRNIRGEVTNVQKTPAQINLFFILIYSLLLAFIVLIILPATEEVRLASPWLSYDSLPELYGLWLKASAIVLLLTALKYFWLSMMSALFGVSEISQLHFFDYLKMGLIFYLMVCLAILVFISRPALSQEEYFHGIAYAMVLFSFFRVLMLFFKLNNIRLLRGVELFSYLCGTEILPLIIGLNVLLNS